MKTNALHHVLKTLFLTLTLAVGLSVSMGIATPGLSFAAGGGGGESYGSPKETSYWVKKANTAISKEDFKKAYSILGTGVKKEPDNADIHNLLGFSSRKMGLYEESEKHYRKALSLDPDHKGALEYMGELFLTLNRPDEARALLERLGKVCWLGCDEKDELKEAIAKWEQNQN